MKQQDLLERITLNERFVSFNRMHNMSANYYHWHQCLELLFVSQGYGIVIVDNQQYTAKPGRLFIFPPFRLHKVHVEQDDRNIYHRTTIHVDHTIVESFLAPFPRQQEHFRHICNPQGLAQVYDLEAEAAFMERLLAQFDQREPQQGHQLAELSLLLMQMLELLPESMATHPAYTPTNASRIMNWIEQHYAQKFVLDDLAKTLNLSKSYTSRVFRQETGGSIQEYLATRRIKRACELLSINDEPIESIASQTGFSETSYFITTFRNKVGQTPLQYRKLRRLQASSEQ